MVTRRTLQYSNIFKSYATGLFQSHSEILYFNDNATYNAEVVDRDHLHKIRPLLDLILNV